MKDDAPGELDIEMTLPQGSPTRLSNYGKGFEEKAIEGLAPIDSPPELRCLCPELGRSSRSFLVPTIFFTTESMAIAPFRIIPNHYTAIPMPIQPERLSLIDHQHRSESSLKDAPFAPTLPK